MADIYSMSFSRVFSLLVAKAERKGKGREEVERIVENLFGYSKEDISEMERKGTIYGDFLSSPPSPNPNRFQKKGRVCSVRVENIENPLDWLISFCCIFIIKTIEQKEYSHRYS